MHVQNSPIILTKNLRNGFCISPIRIIKSETKAEIFHYILWNSNEQQIAFKTGFE